MPIQFILCSRSPYWADLYIFENGIHPLVRDDSLDTEIVLIRFRLEVYRGRVETSATKRCFMRNGLQALRQRFFVVPFEVLSRQLIFDLSYQWTKTSSRLISSALNDQVSWPRSVVKFETWHLLSTWKLANLSISKRQPSIVPIVSQQSSLSISRHNFCFIWGNMVYL